MQRTSRTALSLPALALAALAAQAPEPLQLPGPGPAVPDRFHPDRLQPEGLAATPEPVRGGQVVVHLETPPPSFNPLIEGSGVTRRLANDLHERLVQRDFESWTFEPRLARAVHVEDTVLLADGTRQIGVAVQGEGDWSLTPVSDPDGEPVVLDAALVDEVRPRTVFTFELRDDVRWHDGHPFDAGDVLFTWRCTKNPHVPCGNMRFSFDKLVAAEALGTLRVRFRLEQPYFLDLSIFAGLSIQPAHLFDLADPDNPAHDPEVAVGELEQGRFLVEHPANQRWVGLGPYRVTEVTDTHIQAERFDGYFDAARAGYVDRVRWRIIRDDHTAFLALLNGELDFTARLSSADYFGERAASEAFSERFYTGLFHTPVMSYTAYNLRRAPLDDVRVRRALSMAFDWEAFIAGYYRGLATRVTSEVYPGSPYYDRDVVPVPHDPDGARGLLAEAGWYDRDGDGIADRDGAPLELELLIPGGSATGSAYGQKLMEDLAAVGVRLTLADPDAAAFFERLYARDFELATAAWFMPVESDPEQLWHSRWAGAETGNHAGLADPVVDGLIDALQTAIEPERRVELFHRIHRRVHDAQAYAYGVHVPRKFAASRRLRNVQTFAMEPGYSLRRWYLEE